MIFRRISSRNQTAKESTRGGYCIKKHAKIDCFSSKFWQISFSWKQVSLSSEGVSICVKQNYLSWKKFLRPVRKFLSPEKNIRFWSHISFESKLLLERRILRFRIASRHSFDRAPKSARVFESRLSSISLTGLIDFERKNHHLHTENCSKTGAETCPKSSKNVVWQVLLLLTVAKIPPRKDDTPKVSAAKSTPKSMIFRRNASIEISTRRR